MSKFPVGGGEFTPIPEGVHVAVCKHEGKVLVPSKYSKTSDGKAVFQRYIFQIEDKVPGKDFRFECRAMMGATMGAKSRQRTFVQGWVGQTLDDKRASEFDSKFMSGRACQISITHNENGGKLYANISAIMPLPKGMPNPPFNLEYYEKEGEADRDRWDKEHHEAEEWEALNRNGHSEEVPF